MVAVKIIGEEVWYIKIELILYAFILLLAEGKLIICPPTASTIG